MSNSYDFIFQFYVSPKLASIVLGIVPPVAIAVVVYGRYLRNITKRTQDSLAQSTQVTECQHSEFEETLTFSSFCLIYSQITYVSKI